MKKQIGMMAVGLVCLSSVGCGALGDENVNRTYSGTIDSDQTWSGTSFIEGSLNIEAEVVVEECSTIEVGPNVRINVLDGGALVTRGTEDCPVTITSSQSSPSAGDWARFDFYNTSSNQNAFNHTILEYGGSDAGWGMVWVDQGANVSFSNVTFRDSGGRAAFFANGANIGDFSNVTFANLGQESLRIGSNEVSSLTPIDVEGEVPAIEVNGDRFTEDGLWRNLGVPYFVSAAFDIAAALEIEAGTEVQMGPNIRVNVLDGGSIQANGTSDAPVVITSSKSSPAAGDWARFDLYSSSGNQNSFSYTTIEYGGSSPEWGALWVEDGANVTLDNVTFSNNDGCDIFDAGTVDATASDYASCQ